MSEFSRLAPVVEEHLDPGKEIDLLSVNAGYASFEPIFSVTEESFDKTFATNTRGAFFVAQRLAPSHPSWWGNRLHYLLYERSLQSLSKDLLEAKGLG